ncbi:MAG: type II secretion system F family protein [Alphaproteobacteria bacterium]|nr:type II secretion system F family protein [Alphaproteobacteria bacterium]
MNQVVLSALVVIVLIGAALFASMRADRRRESRQQRLRALVATGPSEEVPTLSLRRPLSRTGVRDFFLLSTLWARLEAELAAAGTRIGLPHLIVTGVAAAGLTVLFAEKIMGLQPALVVPLGIIAAVAAPAVLLRLLQSRYQRKFLDPFPDALDLMCRAVRAGLPVYDAMEVASREATAPVGTELARTLEEMRIGVDIDEALQHTADRIRVPDFRFFAVALHLQRRTGGGLAETLANLSNIIRRRKEIRLKARALSAESKASATVLALLPFAVGALLFFLNPALMSVLFDDPRGRFMTGMALLTLAVGVSVMAFIIRKSLR